MMRSVGSECFVSDKVNQASYTDIPGIRRVHVNRIDLDQRIGRLALEEGGNAPAVG